MGQSCRPFRGWNLSSFLFNHDDLNPLNHEGFTRFWLRRNHRRVGEVRRTIEAESVGGFEERVASGEGVSEGECGGSEMEGGSEDPCIGLKGVC